MSKRLTGEEQNTLSPQPRPRRSQLLIGVPTPEYLTPSATTGMPRYPRGPDAFQTVDNFRTRINPIRIRIIVLRAT